VCHQKDLVTCVSTNGTLLDGNVIDFLQGREMVYLQVSLDGGTSTTNDLIRGAGAFNQIVKALERLSIREIPFSINMVLTKLNFPEISSLYSLAKNYGAKLRVSRFRPSGRGKISWEYLRLGKEELKAFSQWLSDHKDVVTGDSFFSLEEEERRGLGLNLCGAAKFTCCIDPEGKVFPCAFLQDTFFCGGNLLNQSLGEIWSHAHGFTLLRNLKVRSCESCFRYESCHGGCPAVAYFTENTLNIPDPECLVHCIQSVS
jgi:mycofactocin radical SAM maturase